jgi:hypothetical protein
VGVGLGGGVFVTVGVRVGGGVLVGGGVSVGTLVSVGVDEGLGVRLGVAVAVNVGLSVRVGVEVMRASWPGASWESEQALMAKASTMMASTIRRVFINPRHFSEIESIIARCDGFGKYVMSGKGTRRRPVPRTAQADE